MEGKGRPLNSSVWDERIYYEMNSIWDEMRQDEMSGNELMQRCCWDDEARWWSWRSRRGWAAWIWRGNGASNKDVRACPAEIKMQLNVAMDRFKVLRKYAHDHRQNGVPAKGKRRQLLTKPHRKLLQSQVDATLSEYVRFELVLDAKRRVFCSAFFLAPPVPPLAFLPLFYFCFFCLSCSFAIHPGCSPLLCSFFLCPWCYSPSSFCECYSVCSLRPIFPYSGFKPNNIHKMIKESAIHWYTDPSIFQKGPALHTIQIAVHSHHQHSSISTVS